MKKLLISVLIALLLILSGFLVIRGIQIGGFKILGIMGIKAETEQLDQKIQEAGKLAEKDYKQVVSDVETNSKKLIEEKNNYEELTVTTAEGEENAGQIEKYEIETLWVKLGNHATSEGAVIKMDVVKSSSNAEGVYDLKFTVTGSYISITDFISDIENDTTLGFKIDEFKMVPSGNEGDLQATFICKEISIKDVSETTPENTENTQNDGNDQNTTGTDNNTTNTNSTNNTSNTNSTVNQNATNTNSGS